MPGAYAHMTLVNLLKESGRLDDIVGFPDRAKAAVQKYFKYCELGSVSPDYPYLALGDKESADWADTMHHDHTGEVIHAGIRRLRNLQGAAQQKGLAWLLGYAAHVATDVTIHPVVEMKVGPYEGNKTAHRVCEMNQDVYIYRRLDLGGVDLSEHLKSNGVCACGSAKELDPDISSLWNGMLQDVYGSAHAQNAPDFDKWHRGFKFVVDKIATEGQRLVPIARHVAANLGLMYPADSAVDAQFIENLATPKGRRHYDQIFDAAIANVGTVWEMVANGVLAGHNTFVAGIGNWNLDTGRDDNNRLVFWS